MKEEWGDEARREANRLKLFVWEGEGVLTDYTNGMVCVLAHDEEEAFQKLFEKDRTAWSTITGLWGQYDWDNLKAGKIKLPKAIIKPKIVAEPEAFVVWGGG